MPMNNIPVVFISSTAEDLGEYRRAAEAGAQSARFYPEMHDYWVAKDNPPLAECLERVAKADVLVVVVAHRYGWKPPGQPDGGRRSITWLECLEAVDNGKEVLSFLVDDTAEWPVELREENRNAFGLECPRAAPDSLPQSVGNGGANLQVCRPVFEPAPPRRGSDSSVRA
jgi:hypothetical protein